MILYVTVVMCCRCTHACVYVRTCACRSAGNTNTNYMNQALCIRKVKSRVQLCLQAMYVCIATLYQVVVLSVVFALSKRQGNAFIDDIVQTPLRLQSPRVAMHNIFVSTAEFWYTCPCLSSQGYEQFEFINKKS